MLSNASMDSLIPRIKLMCLLVCLCYAPGIVAGGPFETPHQALKSSFFDPFGGNLQQAFAEARAESRQVLLVFGAQDCHYCEQMRLHVYTDPQVRDFYRKHYRVYALDINDPSPMQDETGQTTTVRDFARQNRIRLTPTLIYFDRSHEGIYRQTGYIIDSKVFLALGQSLWSETPP